MKKKGIIITFLGIVILIIGIVFGFVLKDEKEYKDKNNNEIKEDNKDEEKTDEEKNDNAQEETPVEEDKDNSSENEEVEETTPEDKDNDKNNSNDDKQNESSSNNNNKPPNNNNNNGSGSNSNSGSSNNTGSENSNSSGNNSGSTTGGSTGSGSTGKEEDTTPKIVEVTTNNINLNNYSSDIIIVNAGEYTLTGTFKYSIYIDVPDKVVLNLNGVNIKSKTDAVIANKNENELVINVKSGTTNTLSDGIVESSYDGCIFSNGSIVVKGNGDLTIYGNQIDGEGIATKNSPITINDTNLKIYTVDDGLNTGGEGGTITINSGNVYIESGGDAIDSNKDIVINGGVINATGGSSTVNSALDADGGYVINGGTVIAIGTEQLALPEVSSQSNVLCFLWNKSMARNTLITLVNEKDEVIISFVASDKFNNLVISSDKLTNGKYYLYKDGVNTGTLNIGIYSGGSYTKGELLSIDDETEFVVDEKINFYIEK